MFTLGIKDKDNLGHVAKNAKITSNYNDFLKAVVLDDKTRKEIGALGEKVAAEYLTRRGVQVVNKNVVYKTGEIDLIGKRDGVFHFVEVKSILCNEFPNESSVRDEYDPTANLHPQKIRKVARTAEWYVAEKGWEGEWQVDAVLVWLRRRDGLAKVRYLPQIA